MGSQAAMVSETPQGRKEIKMESQDSKRLEDGEGLEVGGGDLCAVRTGIETEVQREMALHAVKQEPEEGLQQSWEIQWQEFLKRTQVPYLESRPLSWRPGESTPDVWASSFRRVAEANVWSRREHRTHLPQEICKAFERTLDSSVIVKEEEADEDPVSLEVRRQHFRRFRYWEAEGPRDACRRLQGLCRQWLRPEKHSPEEIMELVTLEQFLIVLPQEMQNWVREGSPESCAQAVALAEDFLNRVERKEGLELESFEEVIIDSPKAEQDLSDTEEMQLLMGVEQDSDSETTSLVREGQAAENVEEVLQPERPEQDGLGKMATKKTKRQRTGHSLFVLATGKDTQKHHLGRLQAGEVSNCDSQRTSRGFVRVGEMADGPQSPQGVQQSQDSLVEKMLREKIALPEGGQRCFSRNASQVPASEYLPVKRGTECGKSFGRGFDHVCAPKNQSYECSYCGKRWPCRSQLRRHVKIHTGERPHKCADCGKSFSTSSNLSQHKRVHTGERPYSCKDCGKSYRRRASLVQHERETCQKGSPLSPPAVGYVMLGNCTWLCMKKTAQGGRNRVIAPKGADGPLTAQHINIITGYTQEKNHQ